MSTQPNPTTTPNRDSIVLPETNAEPAHYLDAPGRTLRQQLLVGRQAVWHQLLGLRIVLLACAFLQEMHSLVHRMARLYRLKLDVRGVDVGPYFAPTLDGSVRLDRRSHACSADIEHCAAERHWLTPVDVELFREAWMLGAEWSAHNHK